MKNILLTALVFIGLTTISIAQVPAYVPTNGLVGWWPFTGNANDFSGNGNNGTNNGAVLTTDRNNINNSAYYFSSANCGPRIDATVNTSSITNGLTISVWVMRVGTGCYGPRLLEFWPGCNCPGTAQWGWDNTSGLIGMGSTTSTLFNCYLAIPEPPNNVWTHLVYTNDGANGKFYLNGILFGTLASTGNPILGSSLAIGRMNHPAWDAFNGSMDDMGVWNRALTACEITQLYTSSIPIPVSTTTTAASICIGASTTITASGASTYTWMPGNLTGSTITVSPTSTTTYTVTGTNSNGCVNTATRIITVNPLILPVVTTTTSAATICAGASTTITASGATTYAWMPGNLTGATITVSPITTTTYYVAGTSATGCVNTATRIITVNPLPIVTATISSAAVCINDANATLTGTPTGGVWSGTGVTGSNFNPAIAGLGAQTASYSYTDANGCVGIIGTVNIYVYSCVGLEENLLANGVSVYPNPAKNQINVKVDATLIGSIYIVFDNHGKKVLSGKINSENTIVELENLSAGVYLLNIGENLKQTFKVIKE